GAPTKAGKSSTHGEPLGEEEIKGTREKLNWRSPPFEIPEPVLLAWRAVGQKGAKERSSWKARTGKSDAATALSSTAGALRQAPVADAIAQAKAAVESDENKRATRVWSQMVLEGLIPVLPELIGGAGGPPGSNRPRTQHQNRIRRG